MRVIPTFLMLTAAATLFAQTPPITEQATRGKMLFFETTKGQPCGTCHQMEGKGSDAGPDLKMIAALSPKGIIMAVLASRTAYMQEVRTSSGQIFPGLLKGQTGDVTTYYDFSTTPPTKRELKKAEVADTKDNAKWKHPPESAGYTQEQLADVIAYVRWAGKGHTTAVSPADMKP